MSSKRAFVGVSVAFGLLLGAATSGAVTEAKPTDLSTECISPDAAKALSECPAGKMADVHSKRPAAFSSAPPPRDVKKRQDDSKPVNPEELKKYAERDTRKTRLQARARALLITEIQGLERLYKNTPEQSQNYDKAREVYLELIDKAPKSPYIPNAYLAFGELFFQEAQGDPSKWDLAAAAYKEVIKYPPPNNKVYGYARYKLGYVFWNKGDYANALNEFKKVIEYGDQFSDLPNAKQLAKAARRDLIPVYAVSGAPEKAYNFLKPISGDKGGENTA